MENSSSFSSSSSSSSKFINKTEDEDKNDDEDDSLPSSDFNHTPFPADRATRIDSANVLPEHSSNL